MTPLNARSFSPASAAMLSAATLLAALSLALPTRGAAETVMLDSPRLKQGPAVLRPDPRRMNPVNGRPLAIGGKKFEHRFGRPCRQHPIHRSRRRRPTLHRLGGHNDEGRIAPRPPSCSALSATAANCEKRPSSRAGRAQRVDVNLKSVEESSSSWSIKSKPASPTIMPIGPTPRSNTPAIAPNHASRTRRARCILTLRRRLCLADYRPPGFRR